ncbi:hypothetical protein [Vreelandella stevensii]|uniref:hypothetical protein n=1 Tax=Vreelandella stevensii TaxID=502821 RepID=UPI00403B1F9C
MMERDKYPKQTEPLVLMLESTQKRRTKHQKLWLSGKKHSSSNGRITFINASLPSTVRHPISIEKARNARGQGNYL